MADRIILPRLHRFKLVNFAPIFNRDIELSLNGGPYFVLGGNGLGKTTTIQAVVYGIAGEADASIEDDTSHRWNHNYFRERLDGEVVSSAFVEVEFQLGQSVIGIRRGFKNSLPIAFRGNTKKWIDDPFEANVAFDKAIAEFGGYRDTTDFAFIVHRLLYLSESRRLLAWDSNSQLRTVMLLNQDAVFEGNFRRRRQELKEIDSNKRHIHVALGKVVAQLEKLTPSKPTKAKHNTTAELELKAFVVHVGKLSKEIIEQEEAEQILTDTLNRVSSSIEILRDKIDESEASLVSQLLTENEKQNALPLYKLAEMGICPACGTKQPELHATARANLIQHLCVLCGSEEAQPPEQPELSTLRSQLADLIREQQSIESKVKLINGRLQTLRSSEEDLQLKLNKKRSESQPYITLFERDLMPTSSRSELTKLRKSLERQESDLEAQLLRRRVSLERDYQRFRSTIDERVEDLRKVYARYATEFLGIECTLTETPTRRLLSLSRFVPMFNGKARLSPESCSESQQFFLDIAFRLALIEQADAIKEVGATFLCETPENALDMSHVENVVRMFEQFLNEGHSLFLTSNIQRDSIAGPLLRSVRKPQRKRHVINLLEYGRLGSVHVKALPKLRRVFRAMLTQ